MWDATRRESVEESHTPNQSASVKRTNSSRSLGNESGLGSPRSKHLKATLKGHEGAVLCLLVVDDTVWSGGEDKSICVWNSKDMTLISKLKAHDQRVSVLKLVGQDVWSASGDTIKVWSRTLVGVACSTSIWA